MTHSYNITGMSCTSCVTRVKNELLKATGVENAVIQLQHPQATITMSQHIPLPQLEEIISKAGHYTISEYETTTGLGDH